MGSNTKVITKIRMEYIMSKDTQTLQFLLDAIEEERKILKNIMQFILKEIDANPGDSLSDIANEALNNHDIAQWYFDSDFNIIEI
jgi:hypothetical protein